MAVRQREREAEGGSGAGVGNTPGAAESPYAQLERALREAYEAVRSGLEGDRKLIIKLPELRGLYAWVYLGKILSSVYVHKSGFYASLCEVKLSFHLGNGEPCELEINCERLKSLASGCAGGESCELSWEEMEGALRLTGWAVNRLAELAGIPAKVEKVGLVEAYDIRNGKPSVFPCLQVSMNGERRLMCQWAYLRRDPNGGWRVDSGLRLVPIGEAHAKMIGALVEIKEMVWKHIENRKGEGAEHIHAREHQGEFLELDEVALRLPDGAEEVLLRPRLFWLDYLGEDFAVVFCPANRSKISDGELADAVRKELEEALGKVVQAVRRYTETGVPRYAALAYIALEALKRVGLA